MQCFPEMIERSISYILSLLDGQTGGFTFSRDAPVTVNATAIGVICLEFLNALDRLSENQKNCIARFLLSSQTEKGDFKDPLFDESAIATQNHDASYFIEETTTYCQQALHALGVVRPRQREYPAAWLAPDSLITYYETMNWKDPHLNSNRVMFVLSQFAHDIEVFGTHELMKLMDISLDWLDANQDTGTGLWGGKYKVSLSAAMAATFHFTFYYFYRKRPLLYLERIIDSCLPLQKSDGLFSRNQEIGQTCLDYDALDMLAKATLVTNYRSLDILACFQKAQNALLHLCNEYDGGFANCKEYLNKNGERVPFTGLYHTGQAICCCDTSDSNSFSTWFRWLAMALSLTDAQDGFLQQKFKFRPLPWLGYHDITAIRRTYENLQTHPVLTEFSSKADWKRLELNSQVHVPNVLVIESSGKDPYFFLPLMTYPETGHILLTITIFSSENTMFQIFIKPEGIARYLEDVSIRQKIVKGLSEIYALIPLPIHDRIRIDPGSKPGFYIIHKLRLEHIQKNEI